jgi:hypothetical protein
MHLLRAHIDHTHAQTQKAANATIHDMSLLYVKLGQSHLGAARQKHMLQQCLLRGQH